MEVSGISVDGSSLLGSLLLRVKCFLRDISANGESEHDPGELAKEMERRVIIEQEGEQKHG